jgi:hypothetical protein
LAGRFPNTVTRKEQQPDGSGRLTLGSMAGKITYDALGELILRDNV